MPQSDRQTKAQQLVSPSSNAVADHHDLPDALRSLARPELGYGVVIFGVTVVMLLSGISVAIAVCQDRRSRFWASPWRV